MTESSSAVLNYLTVFRSRLGLANLVLANTSFAATHERTLERRLRDALDFRREIRAGEPEYIPVVEYLAEKGYVSTSPQGTTRFPDVQLVRGDDGRATLTRDGSEVGHVELGQPDYWFAVGDVRSTVGVPTPENVDEATALTMQLRLVDKSRYAWTQSGHLAIVARKMLGGNPNPFVLMAEQVVILRALLTVDGFIMKALVEYLEGRSRIRRDEVAVDFPSILRHAMEEDWAPAFVRARDRGQLKNLIRTLEGAPDGPGPGVREHRVSARLEWLTDLGYLSKAGFPRNSFQYIVTDQLVDLREGMRAGSDGGSSWSTSVALAQWWSNPVWEPLRRGLSGLTPAQALGRAYSALRRPIGPVALQNVALLAGMMCSAIERTDPTAHTIDLVRGVPGASLSGGRYDRSPESVYLSDVSLKALG